MTKLDNQLDKILDSEIKTMEKYLSGQIDLEFEMNKTDKKLMSDIDKSEEI